MGAVMTVVFANRHAAAATTYPDPGADRRRTPGAPRNVGAAGLPQETRHRRRRGGHHAAAQLCRRAVRSMPLEGVPKDPMGSGWPQSKK